MTANVIKFEGAAATWERDKRVMASWFAGTSLREIAEHEGCSIDEVGSAIIRQSGGVSCRQTHEESRIVFTKEIVDQPVVNGRAMRQELETSGREIDHKLVFKVFSRTGAATWIFTSPIPTNRTRCLVSAILHSVRQSLAD